MVSGVTAVGVPEISPVVAFRDNPAGRAGETDQEVAAPPPPTVGMSDVIATSFVSVTEVGL